MVRVPKAIAVVLLAGCLSAPSAGDGDGGGDAADPCDGDGDGYLSDVSGCSSELPADCDDTLPGVHPGAYDIPGDALDQDCLGGPLAAGDDITPIVSGLAGNDDITFSNGVFRGRFGAANGYVMTQLGAVKTGPQSFLYGGLSEERWIGLHIWSDYFMWRTETRPEPGHLADGRAVLQLVVDWRAVRGNFVGMTGPTTYTLYPDGRIHLDHNFEVVDSGGATSNTAFISLSPTSVDTVDATVGSDSPIAVGDYTGPARNTVMKVNTDLTGYMCAYHSVEETLVGFGYRVPDTSRMTGPRITETYLGMASHHAVALQYDFTWSEIVPNESMRGDFLVHVGRLNQGDPCSPTRDHVQPWLNPALLTVQSPAVLFLGRVGDDDQDGYSEGGGYYALSAEGAKEIAWTVDASGGRVAPGTSAYRIEGMDLSQDPVILLDDLQLGHGDQYLFQVDTPANTADPSGPVGWLYLDVPLVNGSRLAIRVP